MLRRSFKIVLLSILIVLAAAFFIYNKGRTFVFENGQSPSSSDDGLKQILGGLTLEQKIGQLFIIGFDGKVLDSKIEKLIKELHPGGVLLLGKNIENAEQLSFLIDSLQEIAKEDTGLLLLIAVDQEGGVVSRIDWAEKTAQSEIENKEQAYLIGKSRGSDLKGLGINLNLAPLLDQTFSGDFISDRSFKKGFEDTGEIASFLIKGQRDSGIFSCIKHFPGYGGIYFNPEDDLATLDSLPDISSFEKAGGAFPEMVMVSNVIYKEIEKDVPFSFSQKSVQLLKEKIKGDYLVVSDDLSQYSLLNNFSLKEIVSSPIKSGVDMLIFSDWRMSPEKGVAALKEAVMNSDLSEGIINDKVLKVIELKGKLK